MKIDNGQTNFDPTQMTGQTEGVKKHHHGHGKKAAKAGDTGGQDSVNVSSAAQFASQAIAASQSAPDVRPDVVARAKQMMLDGKIGNDPHRLADTLIDHALNSND
jgi:flagellar biosynthesis anti-sigma factor FlgM